MAILWFLKTCQPTNDKRFGEHLTVIKANSIVEWNGSSWSVAFDPSAVEDFTYLSNITTGIQYKWDGIQWLKSFEGEYAPGYWRLDPEGA